MTNAFVLFMSVLFALCSCKSMHHEEPSSDQTQIERFSSDDSSEGLGLVTFIVGDAKAPQVQTLAVAVQKKVNGRHFFDEMHDKRPAQELVKSPDTVTGDLNALVNDGPAQLVMDNANADRFIEDARNKGFIADRVDNGYLKLMRSESPSTLAGAERKFAPTGIAIVRLQKPKDSQVPVNRQPLEFSTHENDEEGATVFTAKEGQNVVGMASVTQVNDTTFELLYLDISDDKQGKGYGREIFEHVVGQYTNGGHSIELGDGTETNAGQILYGGENTSKKFKVMVRFRGHRQSYIYSKQKTPPDTKGYEDVDFSPRMAISAVAYKKYSDFYSGNAGSVAELMGYLQTHPKNLSELKEDTNFQAAVSTSMKETLEDGDMGFYNALQKLQALTAKN